MNITELIFMSGMLFALGIIFGKCFRKLNPFLMLLGLVIFAPTLQLLINYDAWYYNAAFIFGFITNFGNPFRWITGSLSDLSMSFQLAKARRRVESDFHHAKDELKGQADDLHRQRTEAEEQIRRAAEELKQREENLKRQQEQFYRQQSQANNSSRGEKAQGGSSSSASSLNPSNFSDACEILGVKSDASFAECKKAYRRLMSVYHPDKINQLTGSRKAQAEEEAKQINAAWDTVSKRKKG